MPITWLDLILLGVMLISGLLAMIRGFMREILSITAWGAAAVATLLLYPKLLPIAKANISSDIVATAAVIGGVFLITLLIVSIITVKVSDMIQNQQRESAPSTARSASCSASVAASSSWWWRSCSLPGSFQGPSSPTASATPVAGGSEQDRRMAAGPVAAGHG